MQRRTLVGMHRELPRPPPGGSSTDPDTRCSTMLQLQVAFGLHPLPARHRTAAALTSSLQQSDRVPGVVDSPRQARRGIWESTGDQERHPPLWPPQSRPVQQDVRWFSPRWIRPSTGLLLALRMRVPFLCPDAADIPGSLSHAHFAGPTGLPSWFRR